MCMACMCALSVCVHISVCIHYLCGCMHLCVCAHIGACTQVGACVCMYTCECVKVCVWLHVKMQYMSLGFACMSADKCICCMLSIEAGLHNNSMLLF